MSLPMNRRRVLKTLFCSSAMMNLNLSAFGQAVPAAGTLDLLALGDFGTGDERQKAVARGMARYAASLGKKPDGVIFLGDNFYGPMPGGLKSDRWQTGFSQVYPGEDFPGPCWPILGNHDYHDNSGGELVQIGYAKSLNRKTRWTFPAKFYRIDLPQVTVLMLDTNWETINRRVHGNDGRLCWMQADEQEAQLLWLERELSSKRAPFTVVCGHHPIYSDANHGDTPELVAAIGPMLEKHGVHAYFCGHDHDLQHMELQGLRTSFVLSGGGGARLYEGEKNVRGGSNVFDIHGFTHISIAGAEMTVRHIDPNGKIVHAFVKNTRYEWKVLA